MKKKAMSFHLPEKEKQQLRQFAAIHDLTYTDVIRLALQFYINKKPRPGICPLCGQFKGEDNE